MSTSKNNLFQGICKCPKVGQCIIKYAKYDKSVPKFDTVLNKVSQHFLKGNKVYQGMPRYAQAKKSLPKEPKCTKVCPNMQNLTKGCIKLPNHANIGCLSKPNLGIDFFLLNIVKSIEKLVKV